MEPVIDDSCYIAPDADVLGDVEIGKDCSVWFHAVIRTEGPLIRIGKETNIQDNCVIHTDRGYDVWIGDRVTIGHGAIVHGCMVGEETLIGMGAIILNGAKIGKHCIIGAGALVTERKVIPDNSVVMGTPGKVVREITEEDIELIHWNAGRYVDEGREYKEKAEGKV